MGREAARVADGDEEQQEVGVVPEEGEEDEVEREEVGLAQAREVNASVPPAGRRHPIRREPPVLTNCVPAVVAR